VNTLDAIFTTNLLLVALLLVGAGVVRGFTGFGAALLLAPLLVLLFGVTEGVAIIVLLNVLVAFQLLPKARNASSLKQVGWLTGAACVFIPAGAWALGSFDPELVRRAISLLVFVGCVVIALSQRDRLRITGSPALDATVGGVGGFLNGLGGIGGPPITLYWVAQRNAAAVLRANIILSFAVIHTVTAAVYAVQGFVTPESIARTLVLTPPFMLGAWLGTRFFDKSRETLFTRVVLALLATVAIATLFT
jgi:uncharacterized membrane protein YfcA